MTDAVEIPLIVHSKTISSGTGTGIYLYRSITILRAQKATRKLCKTHVENVKDNVDIKN